MTLYHFGNCIALVYAPYHMAYKFSGISEYASFSKCVYAGLLYIFTQLCKMLLLATFFPDTDSYSEGGDFDFFLEFLKATVDYADLVGLYFAMNAVPGKGHAKILTAAIGWASAEVVVSRSVMLWVGARGSEFDWRYVRACAESNVSLVLWVAAAALVWRARRGGGGVTPGLLLLWPYLPLLEAGVIHVLAVTAWRALALRAAVAFALAAAAGAAYADVALQSSY